MDLIYMNANKEDIGVLMNYELDMAFGSDENTFECIVQAKDHCCQAGFFLYAEGTEYGGIIDGIQSKTGSEEVVYSGRTWHGIIGSKIILPLQSGEEIPSNVNVKEEDSKGNSIVDRYLIVTGDAHDCIRFILERCGLSSLFEVPADPSGININAYQFYRYINAYSGLSKMLASAGAKLKLSYNGGKIIVSAAERYDFSKDDSFDSDLIDFDVSKRFKTVNHLICLGAGELENRLVIHLYADTEGNISQTQTQFGENEYTAVYDYSSVESEEELLDSGTEELKSLWSQDSLSIDYDETMDAYDVGDIVGATENVTGISVASVITKKIVTIKNGEISIDLSTDTVSEASGSGATGNGELFGGGTGGVTSVNGQTGEVNLTAKDVGALPEDYVPPASSNPLDNYPVGFIYWSSNPTSPASLFGGTWMQITDTFILAAGSTYANGSTGGEASHVLTIDEIPAHNHEVWGWKRAAKKGSSAADTVANNGDGAAVAYNRYEADQMTGTEGGCVSPVVDRGGGLAHNNMPPYTVKYCWERTA